MMMLSFIFTTVWAVYLLLLSFSFINVSAQTNREVWDPLGVAIEGIESGDRAGGFHEMAVAEHNGVIRVAMGSDTHSKEGLSATNSSGYRAGHVRVFEWEQAPPGEDDGRWVQLGQTLDGPFAGDTFGSAVDLSSDGSVLAVGINQMNHPNQGNHRGYARVYAYNVSSDLWQLVGTESQQDILKGYDYRDHFGTAISVVTTASTGDEKDIYVGVGAHEDNFFTGASTNSGYAEIFHYSTATNTWSQMGRTLRGARDRDDFGWSIDLAYHSIVPVLTVAIGARDYDDYSSATTQFDSIRDVGHVKIYHFNWTSQDWFQPVPETGIDGQRQGERMGWKVALSQSGDTVAVMAQGDHVKIYQLTEENWDQKGKSINYTHGYSMALSGDGNRVAVGSWFTEVSGYQVRVFEYTDETDAWDQRGNTIELYDYPWDILFTPSSLALSNNGEILAIGTKYFSTWDADNLGAVRVFVDDGSNTTFPPTFPPWHHFPTMAPMPTPNPPTRPVKKLVPPAKCGSLGSANDRGGAAADAKDCANRRLANGKRIRGL